MLSGSLCVVATWCVVWFWAHSYGLLLAYRFGPVVLTFGFYVIMAVLAMAVLVWLLSVLSSGWAKFDALWFAIHFLLLLLTVPLVRSNRTVLDAVDSPQYVELWEAGSWFRLVMCPK